MILGDSLQIGTVGKQFTIPAAWLGKTPDPPSGICDDHPAGTASDRILIAPAEFEKLKAPKGEWKREFASVVDSVMPFPTLQAHLGGDPWLGHCSAMQMRVYVGDSSLVPTDARMETARRVADRFFRSRVDSIERIAGWYVHRIQWSGWYHDYGGDAAVEFYSRFEGGRAVVLVFMLHPNIGAQNRQRDAIVRSWKSVSKADGA